jgi:N6-adenosine-specific RNA methylase IME4
MTETTDNLQAIIDQGQRFHTVYADPPWRYDNRATRGAAGNHYDTMSLSEICDLPVRNIADDAALLWLWTTNGFLIDAFRVIESWGFEYRSNMVWVKPQMGLGNYVRVSHEFLLIANRGGLRPDGSGQRSWIQAPRTKHSEKPHIFRDMIQRISPGPRIELFARQARPDWTAFGNQIDRQCFLPMDASSDSESVRVVADRHSNADKAEAVKGILERPESTTWSNRRIAELAGCTHPFVAKIRKQIGA